MPFLDTSSLKVVERLPGWKGRFFHTATMTFADYEFMAGSTIHEHFHPEEEVYEVIAGELEVTVDAITQVVRRGHRGDRAEQRAPLRSRADRRARHHRRSPGAARVRIEAGCALSGSR